MAMARPTRPAALSISVMRKVQQRGTAGQVLLCILSGFQTAAGKDHGGQRGVAGGNQSVNSAHLRFGGIPDSIFQGTTHPIILFLFIITKNTWMHNRKMEKMPPPFQTLTRIRRGPARRLPRWPAAPEAFPADRRTGNLHRGIPAWPGDPAPAGGPRFSVPAENGSGT